MTEAELFPALEHKSVVSIKRPAAIILLVHMSQDSLVWRYQLMLIGVQEQAYVPLACSHSSPNAKSLSDSIHVPKRSQRSRICQHAMCSLSVSKSQEETLKRQDA